VIRTFGPPSQRSCSLSEGERLKGRTGSLEKPSLIGDRGVESLFFRQRVMVRFAPRAIGCGAQKNGARLGESRAPACQKRLGEIRRRRGKGAGFRENCRSLRFSSDHSRQRA